MKIYRFILFGLFISSRLLNAQADFRPGYIIKSDGDTIYGTIDYRGDVLMGGICKFKDADNTIKTYSPTDLRAYRFIDSKYFVSKEVDSTTVFLEYLIKGKVNIYYMRDNNGDHYYLDKEGLRISEIPYEEEIKYIEDKLVFYESTKHIGFLSLYMKDAPDFQSQINSFGKPAHINLIELAEDYHNIVCEGEKCIIYGKNQVSFPVRLEFVHGIVKYVNVNNIKDNFYTKSGIIGHIWMPRTNEKIYFSTGLLFSQLDYNNEKSNFYKIPFHFEYIYPQGKIRPRLSYGFNYYYQGYQSVSSNFGINIKLTNTLFLSATTDIEFYSTLFIIPRKVISYSSKLGVFLNFE